ncbi:MAG: DUF2071 domain-containing protein [Planctomycetota bacterium]|nr:MAG: DUF2071 domain-containing protein [Planctomycetota bacterium]
MHASLVQTDHRPWPLPRGPWAMTQTWHDLLFAHWPVDAVALARACALPDALELDLYDGRAWLGIVPFRMSGVRVRALPPLPGAHAFPELNVRTYVRVRARPEEKPGVWFLSLDATSALAVAAARAWFALPYFRARMSCRADGERIHYASDRSDARGAASALALEYEPTGPVERARRGSFESWATDRYCLYALTRTGKLLRSEIHHLPWPLQPARARWSANTAARAHRLELPDDRPPHLAFARRIEVAIWAPRRVARA